MAKEFNRENLYFRKLAERKNKISVERDLVPLSFRPEGLSKKEKEIIKVTSEKIRSARERKRPVILAFGAHTIKNGLGPVLIALIREGWVTHLATNGAGIIHDWEFAFLGKTSEDVKENVTRGEFGIWQETGFYINLALLCGAREGTGYGESVGKMISGEGIDIPDPDLLFSEAEKQAQSRPEYAAASLDLAGAVIKWKLEPGFLNIPHAYKQFSVQCAAFDLNVPFTGHPMFGHDIIYTHPMNSGAAVGRTALIDFLRYAESVSNLEHGVYLSLGSAVMSPMVFEKSLSMSQNIEIQRNKHIDNHFMLVVDLAESEWDWKKNGEPPPDNLAYYLRYCKTFSRMGGEFQYLQADNRDFLAELHHLLQP